MKEKGIKGVLGEGKGRDGSHVYYNTNYPSKTKHILKPFCVRNIFT